MPTTIESLELKILSNSENAVNGLEKITDTLNKLKRATGGGLGLTSVCKQIQKVGDAAESLDSDSVRNLNGLARAIDILTNSAGTKISSTVATQITAIGDSAKNLSGVDFAPVYDLSHSLQYLSSIGKVNIGSTVNQLTRIPSVVAELNNADMHRFNVNISELVLALKPLSEMPKQNISSTLTQIKKIPEVFAGLDSVDMGAFSAKIRELASALRPLADEMNKVSGGFSAFPAKIQRLIADTDSLTISNNKAAKSYINLYARIKMAISSFRFISKNIKSMISESTDYIENVNLFNASMGEYANEAQQYAEKVGDIMGIDPGEWMRNQGIFMTLATGFGVAGDRANIMSQQLTQLGYDLSSFFNIGFEESMQKLQSGLSGELEPLRRLGYDLSQAKLQSVALSLGIDKTVSSMTQAEKAQLRYYAIMTQVTTAQGDMARTLDAPANQLRILKAQVDQAGRAIGNIFIPVLNKILPYAIAAAKVLRILASTIAELFGFEMPEVDYSGIGSVAGGADDASNALDEASKSAKKFKNTLLGIDELNILGSNDDSGSDSLLDNSLSQFDFELPTYDFISEATESKVSQIVEEMKEWLGLTGEINSWSDFFDTRLGKILKTVGLIGAGFAAWKIASGLMDGIRYLQTVKSQNFSWGFTIVGAAMFLDDLNRLKTYIDDIADNGFNFTNVTGALSEFAGLIGDSLFLLGQLKPAAALKAIQGVGEIISAISDISNNGMNFDNATTAIRGLSNIAFAIGIFKKNWVLAGAGLTVKGVLGVIEEIKENWNAIKQGDWSGVDKIALAISAIEVLGGIAMMMGKFSKLTGASKAGNAAESISSATEIGNSVKRFKVPEPKSVLKGMADLAIIVGGTTALITAIGLFMQIPGIDNIVHAGIDTVKSVFKGIGEIFLPLAGVSAGILLMGCFGVATIAKGFADFAIILAGVPVVITAIGALMSIPGFDNFLRVGIDSIKTAFNALADVGIELGVFGAVIVALGFVSPATVLSGIAGFALIVGGLELVLVALGALNQIPGFSWIVGEGGEVLKQLGGILGGFAGSIVGGFAEGMTDALPGIADNLSEFMNKLDPFLSGLENVDSETVTAASQLGEMVLALTKSSVLEGLTSWLTGGSSFEKFGQEIAAFAPYFVDYSNTITGIDADAVKNSVIAAQSLSELANNLPNSGGVVGWFMGENDIDVWGAKLPSFGENLKKYADNVKGIDADAVKNSVTAAQSLSELSDNLPNSGGVAGWFMGENDIDIWGSKLPGFGENLKRYSDNVKGIDTNVVTESANAAKAITELSNNLPNSGGFVEWFTGNNDIDKFGEKIAAFGGSLKEYYDSVKTISGSKLNEISQSVGEIIDFAVRIKNDIETKKIDNFTDSIKDLTNELAKLPSTKNISLDLSYDKWVSGDKKKVAEALGLSGWPQLKWKAYAAGGFPDAGQMFIAREAGPEMVGTIGGRTAVANNDQIIDGIAEGVAEAEAEQNALLREQNELLRRLLEKDNGGGNYPNTSDIISILQRKNRRDGKTVVPVGI